MQRVGREQQRQERKRKPEGGDEFPQNGEKNEERRGKDEEVKTGEKRDK